MPAPTAYTNVRAFQRAQAAIETTRGTAMATMSRWLTVLQQGGIVATYARERADEPELTRSLFADQDTILLGESCTVRIEARLSFEELPWWFSLALKGGSAVRTGVSDAGTPPAYTYAITPTADADDLDSFTLKIGDSNACYVYSRVMVQTMTIRCNPNSREGTWRITLDCIAIFEGTGTFDAPADLTRTMIRSLGSKFYIDDALAIGTTQPLGLVRNWSCTVALNNEEKMFPEDDGKAAVGIGRGLVKVTGDFTMEHTSDTYFQKMRDNTEFKIRMEKTGPDIAAGTSTYLLQLDFPAAKLNAPAESYIGQNKVYTYPFLAELPASGGAIETTTVNALATVTA